MLAWRPRAPRFIGRTSGGREMTRIDQLERDKLSVRQRTLYDDIMRTRPRGKLSGPFSVWIHRPDIAEPANGLANCFRVSPQAR